MDKNREHQTVFRWRKAAHGYALRNGVIVSRGGGSLEYDPATAARPLHRVFASIRGQSRVIAANEHRQLSEDQSAPFHMRAFDDVPSAMLAFVNEFGFLRTDNTAEDVTEDLIYLDMLVDELRSVTSVVDLLQRSPRSLKKGAVVKAQIPGTDRTEDRYAPSSLHDALEHMGVLSDRFVGPNLRMVIARNARSNGMEVRYEPESLYAWMWLRTAEDIGGGVDWSGQPCHFCFKPMGRGPNNHRRDAKFCSENHRVYFSRLTPEEQQKRLNEAKDLARSE